MRRLAGLAVVLVALVVAAPVALADGPTGYGVQGGEGLLSPDGTLRYAALPTTGDDTLLLQTEVGSGNVRGSADIVGSFGLPYLSFGGPPVGLSRDGRTLVLGAVSPTSRTKFLVYDTKRMALRTWVVLKGDFTYDALSPDGSRLYLIQHVSLDYRYVVRAYDLRTDRLLPGRVADRTQKGWVMAGYPVTRTTSADGRWVYTLYQNPGGYPFVHALDTVRGVAHCVGLPYTGSPDAIGNLRLTLHAGGRTLAVHWASGRPWLDVDTATWRLSPAGRSGAPWLWIGLGGGVALGAVAALLLRRRFREELEQQARHELGLAEGHVVV